MLVDERDGGTEPRVLFFLEHAIQDAGLTRAGSRRVISRRMLYVELDAAGNARHKSSTPPTSTTGPCSRTMNRQPEAVLARPECSWVSAEPGTVRPALRRRPASCPSTSAEVRNARQPLINKTRDAVQKTG